MSLSSFEELLEAARRQEQPHRLLFVFAQIGLPENATPEQHERHAAGQGGTISPCLCVDKAPDQGASFTALADESESTGQDWDMVFVGALAGRAGVVPSSDEAAQPLRFMVNAINNGRVSEFAAFDREGQVIGFR